MATKYSSEAISAFLEEWQRLRQEGVTQKQFTKDRGLSERTFRSWERRFEPQTETPAELIAKAELLVGTLQRMIAELQSGAPQAQMADWQRWILDAAAARQSGPDRS